MSLQSLVLNSPYWIRQIAINVFGFLLSKKRFSGSFQRLLINYQKNLNKTPAEIEKESFRLLKENLIYSYENIPYYSRIFKENNFDPYHMTSEEEIKVLPFLTKDIIRSEFHNLSNSKIPKSKYQSHFTSGSTGEKLKFFLPKDLLYKKHAAFIYRFYGMHDIKPMDKRVTIGGRKFTERKPFYSYNYSENQLLLSSHHLSNENIEEYLKQIDKFKPVFMQGHPSAILSLAKHIHNFDSQVCTQLKAIFSTGETLIEEDRLIIEKAFNTKVSQQYGSGENCFSTQEVTGEQGYLVNYEQGYIELIGENEYKEVVVTSLQNDVMPFIRYKIGDFVKPVEKRFSKKFGLPILFDEVIGRVDDVITDTAQNTILPVTIRMNMKPQLVVGTNYQLIQKEDDSYLLCLLDPDKKLNSEKIIQTLRKVLGRNAIIEITYVNSITTRGGKIRNVKKVNKK